MSKRLLQQSLALQLVLAGLATLMALVTFDAATALAVATAGIIASADLLVMALSSYKLSQDKVRSRVFYSVALGLKFPALIALVYLLVVVLQMNPLGLIIGFSTLVVAVMYAAVGYQRSLAGGKGS
jgi:hypothetical protein